MIVPPKRIILHKGIIYRAGEKLPSDYKEKTEKKTPKKAVKNVNTSDS